MEKNHTRFLDATRLVSDLLDRTLEMRFFVGFVLFGPVMFFLLLWLWGSLTFLVFFVFLVFLVFVMFVLLFVLFVLLTLIELLDFFLTFIGLVSFLVFPTAIFPIFSLLATIILGLSPILLFSITCLRSLLPSLIGE